MSIIAPVSVSPVDISETEISIEDWFQRTTNRIWPIASQMVKDAT